MTDDFNIGLPADFLLGEMYIYVPIILYMWFSARMSFRYIIGISSTIYVMYFITSKKYESECLLAKLYI